MAQLNSIKGFKIYLDKARNKNKDPHYIYTAGDIDFTVYHLPTYKPTFP
jgi:hypothetical protein